MYSVGIYIHGNALDKLNTLYSYMGVIDIFDFIITSGCDQYHTLVDSEPCYKVI